MCFLLLFLILTPARTDVFEDVVSTIVDGTVLSVTIMDTPGREDDVNCLPEVRECHSNPLRSICS